MTERSFVESVLGGTLTDDIDIARDFFHDTWVVVYTVRRTRDAVGYRSVWEAQLHGPSGPFVYCGITNDGIPVDWSSNDQERL